MAKKKTDSVSFRVSPRTMQMLGRENISSPMVGLIELVKNAYDADASTVRIIFRRASKPEGSITIIDDGEGMNQTDLLDKWLVISTNNKQIYNRTSTGRVKVGEKGIGRLALDRLGRRSIITSQKEGSETAVRLDIDWNKYDKEEGQLHEVEHPLESIPVDTTIRSGTVIELSNLRDQWSPEDYQKLHLDLALLVPPSDHDTADFKVVLDCDEAPNLSGRVSSPMTKLAEYHLESTLNAQGRIHHRLIHRTGEVQEDKRSWSEAFDSSFERTVPASGPLRFTLYFYLRDQTAVKDTSIKLADLRNFLDHYSGVRIYRDKFRVKPYGDPGGDKDWLGLNHRKVRNPAAINRREWVVGESQIFGTISISRDQNSKLQDQTNREGLIENAAYYDMTRFILHAIQFLERERHNRYQNEAKTSKQGELLPVEDALLESQNELNVIANEIRQTGRKISTGPLFETEETKQLEQLAMQIEEVSAQVQQTQRAYVAEQTERQIMLGLSTLGIAMAFFGHETIRAVDSLLNRAKLLSFSIAKLPSDEQSKAQRHLDVLIEAANTVHTWGDFALNRISRDKRTRVDISLNDIIVNVFETFGGILSDHGTNYDISGISNIPKVRAFAMDFEAVIINFIANSLEALKKKPRAQRSIRVTTMKEGQNIVIAFSDSGLGIPERDVKQIFDPLYSTKVDRAGKPVGTGMGLKIVHDIIESYDGNITVRPNCDLGGAEFCISIPNRQSRGKRNGR